MPEETPVAKNRRTGLSLPAPQSAPIPKDTEVSQEELIAAFDELILSASGWRKVFAADRDEESATEEVRAVDIVLVGVMALVFERYFRARNPDLSTPTIAVATDTRDTGPRLADAIVRMLLSQGVSVRYLFVAAAPEIMAYVGRSESIDGFIYVSASHNPRGHNGVKFGFGDGSVLGGEDAEAVRELFRQVANDAETVRTVRQLLEDAPSLSRVYKEIESNKRDALKTYLDFIRVVVAGENPENFASLASGDDLGVVIDFNGSARCVSVDRDFAELLGLEVRAVNDTPRAIAHQIVPEGAGLDQCCRELEAAHASNSIYTFGYVPDNDGDRGNLVYIDESAVARPLAAQETFALACVAELSWLAYTGGLTYSSEGRADQKVAVVVNGPTSLRLDRIAAAFDATVFRAEVGEANVVSLARALRSRGFIVPILGEGSNGGNITHPSTVRDPLATVGAVAKLLVAPARNGETPFDTWIRRRGIAGRSVDRTIPGLLASLPRFKTTSAFESRAKLRIRSTDHGMLKSEYERIFKQQYQAKKAELGERFGIRSWVVINYEGTTETHGMGSAFRSGAQRGGFKVLFKNDVGTPVAFLWMRGSGTEPVFRIMADVEGDSEEDEAFLLDWHVQMIQQADKNAASA